MKDGILWHPKAWNEYSKWIVDRNIVIAKKIVELTKDISKNGLLNGLGKPERLKHYKKAIYSRRITDEHRLVYDVFDDTVRVLSYEEHYKDKNFDEY